jgi:dTDP-4-dehydrorhamnose 3,5-epimerase
MILRELKLRGAFIIELENLEDERGFFARSWSKKEFAGRGLDWHLVECGISFNRKRGTLRGMHYQEAPHAQAKLVRCTKGAIYDVIIDLRTGSPTFKQWIGVDLTAGNRLGLYVPKDFAHGFQTLEDETEVFYQMSEVYVPESGRGARWNDRAFSISWPYTTSVINEKDQTYADFEPGN